MPDAAFTPVPSIVRSRAVSVTVASSPPAEATVLGVPVTAGGEAPAAVGLDRAAQRYRKDAGIGTIISLMLPYTIIILMTWTVFFVIWYLLGIPVGPGYPVKL